MSYLRITEFADRPTQRGGEWYALEARPGSVRVVRYNDVGHLPAKIRTEGGEKKRAQK